MAGGDPLLVRLVVVGSEAQGASITATQLPDFVTLDGAMVRMAPGRGVAPGSYTASFSATSGAYVSMASFTIEVSRFNTVPEMTSQNWMEGSDYKALCVSGTPLAEQPYTVEYCRFDLTPRLSMRFSDAEDDKLLVEFELVPLGTDFTGVPTHSTWINSDPSFLKHPVGELTVDGLVNGTTYAMAMRVCDEGGGCWTKFRPTHPMADGWNDVGHIMKGCSTGTACGLATGATCSVNSDCSSRTCDMSAGGYIGVYPAGTCI